MDYSGLHLNYFKLSGLQVDYAGLRRITNGLLHIITGLLSLLHVTSGFF